RQHGPPVRPAASAPRTCRAAPGNRQSRYMRLEEYMDKTSDQQREKVLLASVMAAASNPGWLTSDRVEALAGGHGMLNIPVVAVCNVIATELRRGVSPEVKFADAVHQPIDDLLAKAIQVAKDGGADGANAALIAAAILYLAGANAQVGIPAGNRKLGSSARMIAGVSRSGLSAVPT